VTRFFRPVVQLSALLLPWKLRRHLLVRLLGWDLHPSASIGFALLDVAMLAMGARSRIGHFTYARHVAEIRLGSGAVIGRQNWISGFPIGSRAAFADCGRNPKLVIGDEAAITNGHRIDCTDCVEIGAFTTVAGWASQIITHSIDVRTGRQRCAPITIGRYCFVGSRSILLKGAVLPDHSVLGAGSVLAHAHVEPYGLYSGVPAMCQKALDPTYVYFTREKGPCL
jgi:acetyltransferase-like isoleucine patch superfamily enzyme